MLRIAVVALALLSGSALAQSGAPTRWRAWVGCWRLAEVSSGSRVCVVPAATPSAVNILTVDSGRVVSRNTVDATGARQSIDRDGCNGWEQANWSKDSLRIYLKSELVCNGGLKRTSSGIMSMTRDGQWVDVQAIGVADNELLRTSRYSQVRDTTGLPAEVLPAVASSQGIGSRAAMIAAGGRVTAAGIVEASHAADPTVVQAWLVERRQEFDVDGRTLVSLADAGVPGSVTDVLVALAYPEQFHVDRAAMDASSLSRSDSARIASSYLWNRGADCAGYGYSPFGWGPPRSCNGYGLYFDRYRYGSGYGYGYGDPYYSGYGYGYGYYGYYTRPVVIVKGEEPTRGVAVKGQGYTRSGSSSGSSSSGSTRSEGSSGSSGSSGGSSSSSGSSGSSSSGGSSSSSSSGRTAKTRPPA
jgi:hypothetical protein